MMRAEIYNSKLTYSDPLITCFIFSMIIYMIFLINFDGLWIQYLWIIICAIISYFILGDGVHKVTIYSDSICFFFPTRIINNKYTINNEFIVKVKYSHNKTARLIEKRIIIFFKNQENSKVKKRFLELCKEDDPLVLLNHFKNLNIPIDFYTQYKEEERWKKEFKTVK